MSIATEKNDAAVKANTERENYRSQLIEELKKLEYPGGILASQAKSDINPIRGLAHFQNAALQFAGALIAAGLIGLANAGDPSMSAQLAGRSSFQVISHVIGCLIAGAILVTIAAAVTQGKYANLRKKVAQGSTGGFTLLWVLSAIGALTMAFAGIPFLMAIFSNDCGSTGIWQILC